jgi:hypothetical protein
MLNFLGHNADLFRALTAMRFDKIGYLVRMEAHGTAKGIGGKFAALGQFVDIDDAAAQYFRYILGSDQRQLGKWGHWRSLLSVC